MNEKRKFVRIGRQRYLNLLQILQMDDRYRNNEFGGGGGGPIICEDYYYQTACLIELSLPAIGSIGPE